MMKLKTQLKRVDYHLTVGQIEDLKTLANKTGIAVASHIRMAVNDYLKKNNEQ